MRLLNVMDQTLVTNLLMKLLALSCMANEVFGNDMAAVQTTATVGEPFLLPCSTSLSTSVDWVCQFNGSAFEQYIYAEGYLVQEYKSRFFVNTTVSGQYDLLFYNVSANDAGLYACVEDNGQGARHEYLFVVADSEGQTTSTGGTSIVTVAVIVSVVAIIIAAAVVAIVFHQRGRLCKRHYSDLERAGRPLLPQTEESSKKPCLNEFIRDQEVIRLILARSIYHAAITNMKQMLCPDAEAVITIRSVCSVWCNVVAATELKQTLRRIFDRMCYPYRWHVLPLVTPDIKTDKSVSDVAYFNGKLYVAYYLSNILSVIPMAREHQVKLEELSIGSQEAEARAIVAWEMKGALVVGDTCTRRLLLVDGSGNVEPWPSRMKHTSPRSLSTFKDRLMVATRRWMLNVYDLDGNRINRVKLDTSFDVSCAFMMPSTAAFVSVCVYQKMPAKGDGDTDVNVRLERIFQQPFHVVFDDHGRSFFSDYTERRVMLMIPGMTEQRVLLGEKCGGLQQPTKLCFAADIGQLFVCDGYRVRAFSVVQKALTK